MLRLHFPLEARFANLYVSHANLRKTSRGSRRFFGAKNKTTVRSYDQIEIKGGSIMGEKLEGKNAVVTGAGRGIGKEIALADC